MILEKLTLWINRGLVIAGGVFLVAMILLTCGNIFLRIVWLPIRGTFELMGFFGAIVTSFALGYTQMKRGHISVDVLFRRFSRRTARVLDSLNHLLCAGFFGIVAWQLWEKARTLSQTGEVSETLRIAYHPFTYGTAVGCGFLGLILIGRLPALFLPKTGGDS